jgi:hypothetical protein
MRQTKQATDQADKRPISYVDQYVMSLELFYSTPICTGASENACLSVIELPSPLQARWADEQELGLLPRWMRWFVKRPKVHRVQRPDETHDHGQWHRNPAIAEEDAGQQSNRRDRPG